MYRKDVNEKSPLRVFERSIHGGLGRGNIGLVISQPGMGKTAFLVDVALDDLMRDRKVFHVDTGHTAEHLRAHYRETFHDLAEAMQLKDEAGTYQQVERNRMIQSFVRGSFDLAKVDAQLGYLRERFDFEPYCLILDGIPEWRRSTPEDLACQLRAIKRLAGLRQVELWLSAQVHGEDERDERGLPLRLKPYLEHISVVLQLVPESDHVRLQLVKDHENPDVAELHLELDPRTLLLKWE